MKVPHSSGGMTWFRVRRDGAVRRSGWTDTAPLAELRERIGALPDEVAEVCVADDFRDVAANRFSRVFFNRARGRIGIELALDGEVERLAPTRMLTANLGFRRALEKFLESRGIDAEDFRARGALRAFSARQFLLPGEHGHAPVELYRGSTLIDPVPSADEDRAGDLATGVGRWMTGNLSADGALPYKYWPSRGAESTADNAIRRFLGSLALARLGELRGSAEIRDAARRNLHFNLRRYFRDIGNGRGAIVERTGAKLGAAALAALAILESPAREEFHEELRMLAAGVDSLSDEELGFRTFFFPPDRDGQNWNFYSGEALLFQAEAARLGFAAAPSLARCAATFERCRARHRRRRNPAFVPWHTQACASLYAQTGRREFADFVFEINDWLAPMQQWDGLAPDLRGRFYNPRRPDFGPPHAASTGAYLEGLADAAALARATGDRTRAAAYGRAVERGLRSLRQLQFRDERDAFYVSKRKRVLGALRTEVYDNAVRVDSAAHALAAVIKIIRPMEFGLRRSALASQPGPQAPAAARADVDGIP